VIYFLDTSALLRTLKNGGPSREVTSSAIVQKLWKYCNVLRDDGMSYGDDPSASLRTGSEQLTYLLFLKMTHERTNWLAGTVRQAGKMII